MQDSLTCSTVVPCRIAVRFFNGTRCACYRIMYEYINVALRGLPLLLPDGRCLIIPRWHLRLVLFLNAFNQALHIVVISTELVSL